MHPEVQARGGAAGLAEGHEFIGLEGMRRWWADFHDAFDEFRLYADEVREFGGRLPVLGRGFYGARRVASSRSAPGEG
jgi:hypothetical protein